MHIKTIQQWESTFSGEGQVDVTLFSPFAPPPPPPISDAQTKLTFVKCFWRASDVMPFL